MKPNYTLKTGDDIYLNENQICTATKTEDEYTTFVMSNGNIIVAKAIPTESEVTGSTEVNRGTE